MIAAAQGPSLQAFLTSTLQLINTVLIPFLFGIAFLLFVINVIRYFVAGAGNEKMREEAKNVATYSILAFVFLGIFWGIVNMLVSSIGLENCQPVESDYVTADFVGPSLPNCD